MRRARWFCGSAKIPHLPPPSLDLLRNPHLKRLAIANPERAPYGRAAVAALQSLNLYDIAQAAHRHRRKHRPGRAVCRLRQRRRRPHLAHLARSRRASAPTARTSSFPRDLYPPIEQGAVIVSNTKQRAAANKLLDFLLSAPMQQLLRKYGLTPGQPVP